MPSSTNSCLREVGPISQTTLAFSSPSIPSPCMVLRFLPCFPIVQGGESCWRPGGCNNIFSEKLCRSFCRVLPTGRDPVFFLAASAVRFVLQSLFSLNSPRKTAPKTARGVEGPKQILQHKKVYEISTTRPVMLCRRIKWDKGIAGAEAGPTKATT